MGGAMFGVCWLSRLMAYTVRWQVNTAKNRLAVSTTTVIAHMVYTVGNGEENGGLKHSRKE